MFLGRPDTGDVGYRGLLRLHVGLDAVTAEPLRRHPDAPVGRFLELAAGSGSIRLGEVRVEGHLDAAIDRPELGFVLERDEVAEVVVARARRRAQFLAPRLGGALTIDVARPVAGTNELDGRLADLRWPVVEA